MGRQQLLMIDYAGKKNFKQSALLLKQLDVFFFYPQTCQASLIIDHYAKKSFLLWQELFPFKQGNGDCLPNSPQYLYL